MNSLLQFIIVSICLLFPTVSLANSCADIDKQIGEQLLIANNGNYTTIKPVLITGSHDIYPSDVKQYGEVARCITVQPTTSYDDNGFPVETLISSAEYRQQLHLYFEDAVLIWHPQGEDGIIGTEDDQSLVTSLLHLGNAYRTGASDPKGRASSLYINELRLSGHLTIRIAGKIDSGWNPLHVPNGNWADPTHSSPTTTIGVWEDGLTRMDASKFSVRIIGADDNDDIGYYNTAGGWINRWGDMEITDMGLGFFHRGPSAGYWQTVVLESNGLGYVVGDPYESAVQHYSETCLNGNCGTVQGAVGTAGASFVNFMVEGNTVDALFYECRRFHFENFYQEAGKLLNSKLIFGAGTTPDYEFCGLEENGVPCNPPSPSWYFAGNSVIHISIDNALIAGGGRTEQIPYAVIGPGFRWGVSSNDPSHLSIKGHIGLTWVDGAINAANFAAHPDAEGLVDLSRLMGGLKFIDTRPPIRIIPKDGSESIPVWPGDDYAIKVRMEDLNFDGIIDGTIGRPKVSK